MVRLAWLMVLGAALAMMTPPGLPEGAGGPPPPGTPAPSQDAQPIPGGDPRPARPRGMREHGPGDQAPGERGEADRNPNRPPRGEGSGPGDRFGPGGAQRPTNEQIDRVVELATQIDPPRGDLIARMRRDNPGQFARWFMQNGRRLIGLMELQKSRPEFFKARLDELKAEALAHRLAAQWAKARRENDQAEQQRLERLLRDAVAQQVDAGIVARGHEVAMLDDRLRIEKEQLKHDAGNQKQLVEQRLEGMKNSAVSKLGDDDDADEANGRAVGEPSDVPAAPAPPPPGGPEDRGRRGERSAPVRGPAPTATP